MKVDPTWRLLEPGLYTDNAGTLHVDAVAYLLHNGYVPTLENQDMLIRAFQEHGVAPVKVDIDGKEPS